MNRTRTAIVLLSVFAPLWCHPAEKLYRDYLGAVKYGNIFSLDVGPDYNGKLREIDVQTLRRVGEMIRN